MKTGKFVLAYASKINSEDGAEGIIILKEFTLESQEWKYAEREAKETWRKIHSKYNNGSQAQRPFAPRLVYKPVEGEWE